MKLFTHCLICGAENPEPLSGGYARNYLTQCTQCGLVFCERIPTEQELTEYYTGYRREFISEITLKRYDEILDRFESFRQTNNLLDVGCGAGYFLQRAKAKGWNVFGTEFTDEAVEHCGSKGINVLQGKLDPDRFDGKKFDVITSFEVIEHINNPNEEIANFRTLLHTGGAVYVTTPNFNALSRRLLGPRWDRIEYPEHLTYYTVWTLKKLFGNHGFKAKEIISTGISISTLKNRITGTQEQHNAEGSTDQELRGKMEAPGPWALAKTSVNTALSALQSGDTLKGFFIKLPDA